MPSTTLLTPPSPLPRPPPPRLPLLLPLPLFLLPPSQPPLPQLFSRRLQGSSSMFFFSLFLFSRGHATLHLAVSVGRSVRPSVRPSVGHNSKLRAVFALPLLPNRPRLDCRVSGLVFSCMAYYSRGVRDLGENHFFQNITLATRLTCE